MRRSELGGREEHCTGRARHAGRAQGPGHPLLTVQCPHCQALQRLPPPCPHLQSLPRFFTSCLDSYNSPDSTSLLSVPFSLLELTFQTSSRVLCSLKAQFLSCRPPNKRLPALLVSSEVTHEPHGVPTSLRSGSACSGRFSPSFPSPES